MNNNFYVYIWTRLDKNEVFYVGKGSKNRYKDMRMRNRYFLNIVNKIGIDNIKIDIIENNLTEEQAFQKEIFYINYYKKQGCNLTNISKGGEGSSGWFDSLSDEEKEKHREISKSFLGKHHTEETRNKMSKSAKGRKMSEETKKKISKYRKGKEGYWKGKHLTEETRNMLSVLDGRLSFLEVDEELGKYLEFISWYPESKYCVFKGEF